MHGSTKLKFISLKFWCILYQYVLNNSHVTIVKKKPETCVEQFQFLFTENAKSLPVLDFQTIVHYKKLILSSMTTRLLLFTQKISIARRLILNPHQGGTW